MDNKNFMNIPIEKEILPEEILDYYRKTGDKKKTATVYCITVKELNELIKNNI